MKKWQENLYIQFKKQQTSFVEKDLQQLLFRLPEEYYSTTDPEDILQNLKYLELILKNQKNNIIYHSDMETFALMRFQYDLLKKTINEFYWGNSNSVKLFRLFKDMNKEFFILGSYDMIEESSINSKSSLEIPHWRELDIIKNNSDFKKRSMMSVKTKNGCSYLKIEILNLSFFTLFKNLLEALYNFRDSFIEIWQLEKFDRKVKSLFIVTVGFFNKIDPRKIESLKEDLERYLQPYLTYRSIFDIIGPAMVGPSSSHTAGANRMGQIARQIFDVLIKNKILPPPEKIKIKLMGSFRDTGIGHHTLEAIIGGLCGYSTDDESMIKKGLEAIKEKDKFHFTMNGVKILFGGFLMGGSEDDSFYKSEQNNNIAEIIAFTKKEEFSVTGFSIGGGNVEIRFFNRKKLDTFIDGKRGIGFNPIKWDTEDSQGPNNGNIIISPIDGNDMQSLEKYNPEFNTIEEFIEEFGASVKGEELVEKIIEIEQKISGRSKENIFQQISQYWQIMRRSIEKGLQDTHLSTFQLTGRDAQKIHAQVQSNILGLKGNIYSLALTYAVSVNEINAKSGLIVACPTGGSCGILPGVIRAWEQTNPDCVVDEREQRIMGALIIAGFFGMILFDDVPTAGADLGCQAEIGGGAAMTAAALVFLEGGTLSQMVEAFTLALKNCMGLVCDPVAGLVEVPCVKRNGIYATTAISAAIYALSGVKSMVSPDQVILAVKEVGEKMHNNYKETAKGGLAQTRDGKRIGQLFKLKTESMIK